MFILLEIKHQSTGADTNI